jgi:hypothetical protein
MVGEEANKIDIGGCQKKEKKGTWGPILVEKRPTRVQKDRRIVLEKAHDRKKRINLETTQGINHNSFSLLADQDILHMAKDTGVSLGTDSSSERQSVLEILAKDRTRNVEFDNLCAECKVDKKKSNLEILSDEGAIGEDAPCTPETQIIRLQMGDASDERGQLTYVGKKRKPKSIVTS